METPRLVRLVTFILLCFSQVLPEKVCPIIESTGCFKKRVGSSLILHSLISTDRDPSSRVFSGIQVKWWNWDTYKHDIACRCARVAKSSGYQFFGVHYYGECWSVKDNIADLLNATMESNRCFGEEYKLCGHNEEYCAGDSTAVYIYQVDINECLMENKCDVNAVCIDTPHSYKCKCKKGYIGNGTYCEAELKNLDHCELGKCDPNAVCINSPASYSCKCKKGFIGNGIVCKANTFRGLKNSAILSKHSNINYFKKLTQFLRPVLKNQLKSHWIRCWRASTDGWDAKTFHRLCDSKGPTVTLVSAGSDVFGGYVDASWESSGGYAFSSKAFLFSLFNIHGYSPLKLPVKSKANAIYRSGFLGPTFGSGHDLTLDDMASRSDYNEFYMQSYSAPPGCHPLSPCYFFTGKARFQPSDIEVFYDSTV